MKDEGPSTVSSIRNNECLYTRRSVTSFLQVIPPNRLLHEIIQEILSSILITTPHDLLLRKQIIISVIPLPRLLLPFSRHSRLLFPSLLRRRLLPFPHLALSVFPFRPQVRESLDARLVQPVDDGVGACRDEDLLDLHRTVNMFNIFIFVSSAHLPSLIHPPISHATKLCPTMQARLILNADPRKRNGGL